MIRKSIWEMSPLWLNNWIDFLDRSENMNVINKYSDALSKVYGNENVNCNKLQIIKLIELRNKNRKMEKMFSPGSEKMTFAV